MLFSEALEKLVSGKNLSGAEAYGLLGQILEGRVPQTQTAAFLTALRAKGETAEEIAGFVKAMRNAMTPVPTRHSVVVDTCGTGGDGSGTVNISTAAAFVVSGAGLAVAKHGNRSVSSKAGSADVLEALGVKIDMPPLAARRALDEIGLTFLFAPLYHPAMKNVAPVRKELGIRTIFNLLGPLSNPARANVQVIGVPRKEYVTLISGVLSKLSQKSETAFVIHEAGHDEMILAGTCGASHVHHGKAKLLTLSPKDLGLKKVPTEALRGGDAAQNAKAIRAVLENKAGPLRDVIVANAALAIYAAGCLDKKLKVNYLQAMARAHQSLESGAALRKLSELVEWSHKGE